MSLSLPLLLSVALAAEPDPPVVARLIDRMRSAAAAMRDGTYRLRREEWKDGRMLPVQELAVKYRRAPESIYLHWVGETYRGREVLWRRDSDLLVNVSAFVPNLTLAPQGTLAMRDSRHPIWMAGLPQIVDLILKASDLLGRRADLQATYTDLGAQDVFGTPSRCYRIEMPYTASPETLYAPLIQLCLGDGSGLPSRFTAWANEDGQLRQVEDYAFTGLKVNVGLTAADFAADNPAYGF